MYKPLSCTAATDCQYKVFNSVSPLAFIRCKNFSLSIRKRKTNDIGYSSRSPKSAKQPQAGGGTIRRGTFRRNASCQSNRSSLTSLAVSGRKVMEMPKAPPLRPKAKDETPREKQSEVRQTMKLSVPRQTWLESKGKYGACYKKKVVSKPTYR